MLIKHIITEDVHDDNDWAQAHMPGGSADTAHAGALNDLLKKLTVNGKTPGFELSTVGEVIKGQSGKYPGVYLMFSKDLEDPTQAQYIYIGLGGAASDTSTIMDRWKKEHWKAYSGDVRNFFDTQFTKNPGLTSPLRAEKNGILYTCSTARAGNPTYGKPFPHWVETEAQYFLTPESYKELKDAVFSDPTKTFWEPNTVNGQYIDPNTNQPTNRKWIRTKPWVSKIKLEMNPDRNINKFPVALFNLSGYEPWAIAYAEAMLIDIYKPVGNSKAEKIKWHDDRPLLKTKTPTINTQVKPAQAAPIKSQPTKHVDTTIQQSLMTQGTALNNALVAINPAERSEARDEAIEYMNDGRTAQEVLARLQSWVN